MTPEHKFAALILLLLGLLVFLLYCNYCLRRAWGLGPRVTYNNPWEFSPVRKPLLLEKQK